MARAGPRQGFALFLLVTGLLGAGCNRETRAITNKPETGPGPVAVSALYPGGPPPKPAPDPREKEYEGNAFHISQGQKYFRWFNCNGCHFNGGGGIGPPLMDAQWRYGGSLEQIYATIDQGRPNGMPAFGDKIPPSQMWEIAAYVRSLSGNADPLAVGSRTDEMQSTPPTNHQAKTQPKGDAANVQGTQ